MTSRRAQKRGRPANLRAALARRTQRVDTYRLPVVPSAEADAAAERHRAAHERLEYAKLGAIATSDDPNTDMHKMLEAIEKEHETAKAALDECFWDIKVRGLSEPDFDALVNEHPPADEQLEENPQAQWNRDTFAPALAAACVVDGDLTADEWREELDTWPRADKIAFVELLYGVNRRSFTDGIPKD